MIFLGDIAHPYGLAPKWSKVAPPWSSQAAIANLEGPLVVDVGDHRGARVVFNHISILEALGEWGVVALSLANNHISDIRHGIERTFEAVADSGIHVFGAGCDSREAARPAIVSDDGVRYVLLGFGWSPIRCRYATPNEPGVNPFEPETVLRSVEFWREAEPDAAIVVVPHWNFELEAYPQPAHRQLAFSAIDAGATAVIGHHSHRVAGIEVYRGCPVAYSLGNWWMPQGVYMNGSLCFPDDTLLEAALEWTPDRQPVVHWFDYERTSQEVRHSTTESFQDSSLISALTPYAGLSHDDYVEWFRQHRVKRRGLPVYVDYRSTRLNAAKDRYVRLRHEAVTVAVRFGLR